MIDKNKNLTCFDVADYFIWLANETGSFLSNLKLQKLVYYAQSWHLALHEKPLFDDDFEAWIHGPVIPELYKKYQRFQWYPIKEAVTPKLPSDVVAFLQEVADEYFACDGYELEKMTHIEKPWKMARGCLLLDEPSHTIIRKDWIKEYYASRVQEQEENQQEVSSI
ncbi:MULTISPECIES: type II toxin-antitoxin system antitoxin SocA domain-containing protein [Spirulina sp. CCY15215]|uniref:Panacea domain-containing protein n=1 Tax=Spirulina sp. CCY15215 TaxID=2767591 RepID=UPI00194FA514|nr:type II toxin-antitoxin system antitoxin SocA domain-containing protein [Spirulina major]